MAWKVRTHTPFDFEHPFIHLAKDEAHLSFGRETMQVWIGADEPMRARLLLVVDARGIRVEWQKGYTQGDLHSASSVLRSLGIPRPVIGQALHHLHRQLHTALERPPS